MHDDDAPAEPVARMVDVAFALEPAGPALLPREYRALLARALEDLLPWLAQAAGGAPAAGVHRLNVSAGAGPQALLSRRTRLVLRVPRERSADALALAGTTLALGATRLHVGEGQVRELLPWGTLYAHCVSAPAGQAEIDFLHDVQQALRALDAPGRAICGRALSLEAGAVQGFSLMVDGLSPGQALRLMDRGVGAHRRLGCGLFVPHKSAAAVGVPP